MYYLKINGKKVRPEDVTVVDILLSSPYPKFQQDLIDLRIELIMLNRRYGYAK